MKEQTTMINPEAGVRLNRRGLLGAAAAAGGVLIVADVAAAALPTKPAGISDPRLRTALLQYGGEFGQIGKGGSHGDI